MAYDPRPDAIDRRGAEHRQRPGLVENNLGSLEAHLKRVPGAQDLKASEAGRPLNGLRTMLVCNDRSSVFAQYTVLVPSREKIQAALKELGIPTAVHYHIPLNLTASIYICHR